MPDSTARLIDDLLEAWRQEHSGRARGGVWALSGFAYQFSTYLLRFFRGLLETTTEPGLLAEMERLSDILCPSDGKIRLVQVKTRLTKGGLADAAEEAYLILRLCDSHTPDLSARLCFQIAYRHSETDLLPGDLQPSDVLKGDVDTDAWQRTLNQYDPEAPVLEEPDPRHQLHSHLWNAGVADTESLIHECTGVLLDQYDVAEPSASRDVGRRLNNLFRSAPKWNAGPSIGRLLTLADVEPDPDAASDTGVLTGQAPYLSDLTRGRFRDRPQLLAPALAQFEAWWESALSLEGTPSRRLPVFWISGRSGEGKSVLLLQLVAALLRDGAGGPLLHLHSPEDFAELLTACSRERPTWAQAFGPIAAVVDDVYNTKDRETFGEAVRNAWSLEIPSVCLITCGPTEQMEQFRRDLADCAQVQTFEVPHLDLVECEAFRAWYCERTGQNPELDLDALGNSLLVLFMFELAQGERMPDFAKRFRDRLTHLGLFKTVRTIAAVNAVYIEAPFGLVPALAERDALRRLGAEDQLHFAVPPETEYPVGGVRFLHPHLAWLIYVEWVDTFPSLGVQWGRELAKALNYLCQAGESSQAGDLLHRVLTSSHLYDPEDSPPVEEVQADRRETLRALYRQHCVAQGGRPAISTVPRWLDISLKVPGLVLQPDPIGYALQIVQDPVTAPQLHAAIACWLWRHSHLRSAEEGKAMKHVAYAFLDQFPHAHGVCKAVIYIASSPGATAEDQGFAERWAEAHLTEPQTYEVLAFLVAKNPTDDDVRQRAVDWLEASPDHLQAYWLLAALVANNPTDDDVRQRAVDWLKANPDHLQAYWLLAALVANNPADDDVKKRAVAWLEAKPDHPYAYHVLAPLVANHPADEKVVKRAVAWLEAKPDHPYAYHVLAPLVAKNPTDDDVKKRAVAWLEAKPDLLQAYELLRTLVANSPADDDVKQRAVAWLEANPDHPQAHQLLAPLVANNPTDDDVKQRAVACLEAKPDHPHAQYLLATLIARTDGDPFWLARGEDYLQDPRALHPQNIIAPLLTAAKADPRYVTRALAYCNTAPKRHRAFVMHNLGRALAHNPDNALRCFEVLDDQGDALSAAAALGLKRASACVGPFVDVVLSRLGNEALYHLLRRIVRYEAVTGELAGFMAEWLQKHHPGQGYRSMLGLLAEHPGPWEAVLETGLLPQNIIDDYKGLTTGTSA